MDPYHEGERAVQVQAGERSTALASSRILSDRIPATARAFVERQRCCVLTARAADGEVWVGFLAGAEGFASTSPDLKSLDFQLSGDGGLLRRLPPLAELEPGASVGALLIDLSTRRRLRVNGTVGAFEQRSLRIEVEEAFANCPRYIQRRELAITSPARPSRDAESGELLGAAQRRQIEAADTCFVGSGYPGGRLDASHRGGRPGFVEVRDGVIRVPDYPGNGMFSTLGNVAVDPRAGLTFVDFENGRQLQLTGRAILHLDGSGSSLDTGGTGRWWEFRTRRWTCAPLNAPQAWVLVEPSPHNP